MQIKTTNTILYCEKWQETVTFYREILKLDINFSNEWFVEFVLNDQARLSIANQDRTSVKSCGGKGITVCFQIDDIEIMHKYLQKVETHPTPIKKFWESRVFYIRDPEGNRLEFWS